MNLQIQMAIVEAEEINMRKEEQFAILLENYWHLANSKS